MITLFTVLTFDGWKVILEAAINSNVHIHIINFYYWFNTIFILIL